MEFMLTDADTETIRAAHEIIQLVIDATPDARYTDGMINTQSHRVIGCLSTLLIALDIYADDPATEEWAKQTRKVIVHASVGMNYAEPPIPTDADTETLYSAHRIIQMLSETTLRDNRTFGGGIIYTRARDFLGSLDMFLLTLQTYATDPSISGWAKDTDQALYH